MVRTLASVKAQQRLDRVNFGGPSSANVAGMRQTMRSLSPLAPLKKKKRGRIASVVKPKKKPKPAKRTKLVKNPKQKREKKKAKKGKLIRRLKSHGALEELDGTEMVEKSDKAMTRALQSKRKYRRYHEDEDGDVPGVLVQKKRVLQMYPCSVAGEGDDKMVMCSSKSGWPYRPLKADVPRFDAETVRKFTRPRQKRRKVALGNLAEDGVASVSANVPITAGSV